MLRMFLKMLSSGIARVYGAKRFSFRFGKGRAIAVIAHSDPETLSIVIQRKIGPADVRGGKMVRSASEGVSRRGGKRVASLNVSLEDARALHKLLGQAIKHADREIGQREMDSIWVSMFTRLGEVPQLYALAR